MAELELQGLHKQFGAVVALKSLDLAIRSSEFVSFLGPSGCGKTTALRIIAGFEQPDSGRVVVGGKDVTRTPANRRDMGMVFQAYSLFPNLTAQENVAFGLRVRRMPRSQRSKRAAELLELVGLASATNRYPHQLSGGQQQRVALARALAIEPRVLLLDEPLSALDAKVRVQLRDEIRRIQTRLGITTLYVTHDQEEALSVSDRVAVLSQGQIEQVGTPAEIYGDPRTVFVAQFVGTMNRIAGTIRPGGQGLVESHGALLRADNACKWASGGRVLLLIRPESIALDRLADGAASPEGGFEGRVRAHTFMGPVTRLKVVTAIGEVMVDVGSAHALALGEGTRVALTWDPAVPRLIDLTEGSGEPAHVTSAPADLASGQLQGVETTVG
jgi:putative spermidine/putrescine transport system ATP-binding protein